MMKRLMFTVLLIGMLGSSASAALDLGQICWNTAPANTLRIWAVVATGNAVMFAVPAVEWRSAGVLQMGGAGSANPSHPTPNFLTLDLIMSNSSAAFNGNPICKLRATLDPATLNGPWTINCISNNEAGPFTTSGTMTITSC
jgi:hypothetical protein